MTFFVVENGVKIAAFLRLPDAWEFMANMQYEHGGSDYIVVEGDAVC